MKNKRIVILGAGESGIGAALLARVLGAEVWVSDSGPIAARFQRELQEAGIPFEEKGHDQARIAAADLIIKSPGIAPKTPIVAQALKNGKEIIGEIEFAYRHAGPCRIIAITGSNGKTTTTKLCGHLLTFNGRPARIGGNIGHSFARLIADDIQAGRTGDRERIFVLEVSSFQLDDCSRFRPHIGILLNITPDHLDRYDYDMARYVASKFKLAARMGRGDLLITNADDAYINTYMTQNPKAVRCKTEKVAFANLRNAYVRIGRKYSFDLSCATGLRGLHNYFNAACAIRAALRLSLETAEISSALYHFKAPRHRLESLGIVGGVEWINDSKATNVDSVFYALTAMDKPTIWIAGGQDKGNDYDSIRDLVVQKVKALVCMGADNRTLIEYFEPCGLPLSDTHSLNDAVAAAKNLAQPGDAVLLSPACASFDLFKNFEDRGDQFKRAVQQLAASHAEPTPPPTPNAHSPV